MSRRDHVILLVEDNADDIELTELALQESNIANKLVVARDGVQALDYLFPNGEARATRDFPQVVLLDLKLPKIDGFEVLARIRADEHMHGLPVVVLTSSDEERDLFRAYDMTVNSFIRKPVDFAQFVDAVKQLGMYWLVLNRVP